MLGNAETLELRRLKSDLTMIFKIVHKLVAIDFDEFFLFYTIILALVVIILNLINLNVILMRDIYRLLVAVLMSGTLCL